MSKSLSNSFAQIAPIFIFIPLAYWSNKTITRNVSLIEPLLDTVKVQYQHKYTGIPPADDFLAILVAVFQVMMEPDTLPFLRYFLTGFAGFVVLLQTESRRHGRSGLLSFPMVVGMIFQVIPVGVISQLYWVLFLLSGAASRQFGAPAENRVTRAHSEAIVAGVGLGTILMNEAIFRLRTNPKITALWQAFPVWTSVFQNGWLVFRSPKDDFKSGYPLIRALYIFTFLHSAWVHVSFVFPAPQEALSLLIPTAAPLNPSTPSPFKPVILDILQWDMACTLIVCTLGSLWFAKSAKQLGGIVAWYLVASPIVGPWAAFTAVALWRETKLTTPQAPKVKST